MFGGVIFPAGIRAPEVIRIGSPLLPSECWMALTIASRLAAQLAIQFDWPVPRTVSLGYLTGEIHDDSSSLADPYRSDGPVVPPYLARRPTKQSLLSFPRPLFDYRLQLKPRAHGSTESNHLFHISGFVHCRKNELLID
jgi:hypothetical protein